MERPLESMMEMEDPGKLSESEAEERNEGMAGGRSKGVRAQE